MRERGIDQNHLQGSISEFFGEKVDLAKIDPIEEGFSSSAYKLSLMRGGKTEDYFLKRIEDQLELMVYSELIFPLGISAPRVYGILTDSSQSFLLMEYVDHAKPQWEDESAYFSSLDLLIEKDQLARDKWSTVRKNPLVYNGVNYNRIIRNVFKISEGKKMGIHNSYGNLSDYLQRSERKLRYMKHMLSSRGTLTLCHNDFHLNNVVFSKTPHKAYLIDWTKPSTGSVFIDLAKMVNIAPDKCQKNLIEYYEQKMVPERVDELYPLAEAYDHLGVISWAVDAVKSQREEVLQYIDFDFKSRRLIQVLAGISI